MMTHMNDELVQVWSTGDQVAAEITRARLEDAGIEVLVKSSMGGSSAYPVGPSYLFVKADKQQDARAVIQAIESGEYALDDEDVEEAEQAPPASDA
jgi:putative signal transducing protein